MGNNVGAIVFLAGVRTKAQRFVFEGSTAVLVLHENIESGPEIIDVIAGFVPVGLCKILNGMCGVYDVVGALVHLCFMDGEK